MPEIMMDQASRCVQAGKDENDRRDRAMQFPGIVAECLVAGIERRNGKQAEETIAAHIDEKDPNKGALLQRPPHC